MKTNLIALTAILSLAMLCPMNSIAADTLKIGYVNPQRIIEESKAGKDAYQQLKTIQEEHRKSVETKKAEIDKADEELQKQYKTLSETARVDKEESLKRAKTDFKRMLEDADNDIANREKAFLEKIDKEVMEVIQKFGKDEGYSIILGKVGSTILYASPEMDLSEKIIKLYDQTHQQ